ncbi:MAG: NAD(P)/FAD-dependent oxidoreductase [Bacteroidales bacterium]|jgi:all-trans-retinol 13,14-reductase|nr:NAD(P)/FAD-dependent oxidoreductase [Bacteroidales bacterium]
MNSNFDIVIAGSGLGGLVCGYILSKNGFKVAIVEKNRQIGGCLQTFSRRGTKFDTGMHYIGSMEEGQVLYKFFKYLHLLQDVRLKRLDNDGYDIISFNGERYKYASGFEHFIDTLSQNFPQNRADITKYINKIREIANASPLYKLQRVNTNSYIEADYIKTSVDEFIESCTRNPLLQNVLTANQPLYAGIRGKTPTYIHALINNFYIQSAFRIVGGSDSIASSLASSMQSFGGQIYTQAEVEEFVCNEERITNIRLTNGNELHAKTFISNIHPQVTMEKIHSKLIRKVYKERINSLENTISNFTVFIKFKEDTTLKYLNSNFYYYEKPDVWACNNYDEKRFPQSYLYMHQCENEHNPFATSAQIIAYMPFSQVNKWANTILNHRGLDYEAFKQEKASLLLDLLENEFPGTKAAIDSVYTSSPLTYRDYTATKEGSMYGILRDKNFPMQSLVSQRTKIPNLLLTGQNINSHGILGVIIGSIITCSELLGMEKIMNDIALCN